MLSFFILKMRRDEVESDGNLEKLYKSNICNISILIFSLSSIIADVFVGSILTLQYYLEEQRAWAIATFSLVFFPSVVIHAVSMGLHVASNGAKPVHWLLHSFLLGIFLRYVKGIRQCVESCKSKKFLNPNLKRDIVDLHNLYLFKSFLECAPQLVLQCYILSISNDFLFSKGFSAVLSSLSLIWALAIQTKKKVQNECPGLVFVILWRTGMMTARMSALILCACACGPWIILFMGVHWLAMTLWIVTQKTSFDRRSTVGLLHVALFAVVYCFCFFSLRNGRTRLKASVHNLLILFENLVILTVFLMRFSENSPKLSIFSFVTVVCGNILGVSSFLLYNVFFHPKGALNCIAPSEESQCRNSEPLFGRGREELAKMEDECPRSPSSDSVVVVEETANDAALSVALKRRAICSSVDLSRFVDAAKVEDSPSDAVSTHDYENLCAVNIAREPWGIRSWRSYSDIETLGHDDSVVNERRTDNMTTSSDYSGKYSVNTDDLSCEDANSDKTSVNFVPPLPTLDTILEEREMDDALVKSESALVATIDKICLNTPLRRLVDNYDDPGPPRPRSAAHKFSIFRETNRYEVKSPTRLASGKENVPGDRVPTKRVHFRDRGLLLVQALTPSRSQRRTFHVTTVGK